MRKIKYYYNTHTLRFEKLITPFRVKLLRIFGFIAASVFTAFIIVVIAFQYVDSPEEKLLKAENNAMREDYAVITARINELQQQMQELQTRDNEVYRAIFEAEPVPDSARIVEMEKTKELEYISTLGESQLTRSISSQLNVLSARVAYQEKSYVEIDQMLQNKEKLLAGIPAIQPVANKDLRRVASGFGFRIDPVYKVRKFHAGLDFTAPQGTPIYATADGKIKTAGRHSGGYGNHVVINHGYGYETLYAHMLRVKVRSGETVKRGEVIGWVGNTGKSTGPHCHYEVRKNGNPVDPIFYFYNDLTPEQFDLLLKLAASSNQSLD